MREELASIKQQLADTVRRVGGHGHTLYGAHGNGGLSADVHSILVRLTTFISTVTKALDDHAVLLVGADGKSGIVADHADFKATNLFWRMAAVAIGSITLGLLADKIYSIITG